MPLYFQRYLLFDELSLAIFWILFQFVFFALKVSFRMFEDPAWGQERPSSEYPSFEQQSAEHRSSENVCTL